MDKLNLNLDDLNVNSFATEEESGDGSGTVRGQFTDPGDLSCDDRTCLNTCPDTCDATCGCGGGGGGGNTQHGETACSICSPTNIWEPCDAY
jgi:hypothetical protein